MKFYKAIPDQAKIIGNSLAIYHGPGPADAVRVSAAIAGSQNSWITQVWTEYLDSIPHDSVPQGANLGFTIGDIIEIEPNKIYHINIKFFAL